MEAQSAATPGDGNEDASMSSDDEEELDVPLDELVRRKASPTPVPGTINTSAVNPVQMPTLPQTVTPELLK